MKSISIKLTIAVLFILQSCSIAQIPKHIEQWQPNVCRVTARDPSGIGAGTGCYLGNGYVLTAYHVVRDYDRSLLKNRRALSVKFYGQGTYAATVSGRSPRFDVAYLKIDIPSESNIKGVLLASSDPKQGDTAWKCGFGPDNRLIWHKCTVTGNSSNMQNDPCWFDMTPWARSGDSGGPVFDNAGRLLGNLWGSSPDDNATTAVRPSAIATSFGSERNRLVNYHVNCYGPQCYGDSPFIWQQPQYQQPSIQPQRDPRLEQPAAGGIPANPNAQNTNPTNPNPSPSNPQQMVPVQPKVDLSPLKDGIAKLQEQFGKLAQRNSDSKLQSRLDSLGNENKSLGGRLDDLSGRLKELPEKIGGKISGAIGGVAESSPQESGFDWTSILANVGIAALGVAGVGLPAWAIWAWRGYKVVRSVRKRRRQRKSRRQPPPVPSQRVDQQRDSGDELHEQSKEPTHRETTYIIDAPPLPERRTIETRMVEVPVDNYEVAHEWARREMFRKWPGSHGVLDVEKKLIKQRLAADRVS